MNELLQQLLLGRRRPDAEGMPTLPPHAAAPQAPIAPQAPPMPQAAAQPNAMQPNAQAYAHANEHASFMRPEQTPPHPAMPAPPAQAQSPLHSLLDPRRRRPAMGL